MDIHAPSRLPYDRESFHDLFRSPPAGYRGAPFWSWNGELRREELLGHLERFTAMGMGGATVHPRTGLRVPFMGREFLGHVQAAAGAQRERGGLLWLYDEDRWPSGFAGGLVTRDHPEFRKRYLVLTPVANADFRKSTRDLWHSHTRRNGTGREVARYALRLDGPRLRSFRRLGGADAPLADEEPWWAYLEVIETHTWYNHATYVDTLNPRAIEAFTAAVHQPFADALGDHLGSTVPAIFTDEPMLSELSRPERGDRAGDRLLSWTDDFADTYRARFGGDPLDTLPEVVWDLADGSVSPARWRYHEHRSARFAESFAGTLGRWCDAHGIALTGHLMAEESLTSQVSFTGESMRSYRHFAMPGIDMLCDWEQPVTAKQAASVARQCGRTGVLSELYGVTGWHFDFTGHKRQGDWQAALGITIRVHHLSWINMGGEAKRDYPAPIDWHSPWWRDYRQVEDHFARVNTVLTRGRPLVRVGLLHPVESAWHHFGPGDGTGSRLGRADHLFDQLTRRLIESLVDFDYIAESLLPDLHRSRGDARFGVGGMAYEVVVLPGCTTLRRHTLSGLEAFRQRGGRIIVLGEVPTHVEGEPAPAATAWLAGCERLRDDAFPELVSALEPLRLLRATRSDGDPAARLSSQLREEGDARWLFVCDSGREGTGQGPLTLGMRGAWEVERLDTATGTTVAVPSAVTGEGGDTWTAWTWTAHAAGHELVRLAPRSAAVVPPVRPRLWCQVQVLHGPADLACDEPNVLLLDRAEFRLDGAAGWEGPMELLRLDNVVRSRLGLPDVHGDIAQPWAEPPAPVLGQVDLRFTIDTAVAVRAPHLALEGLATSRIALDGVPVAAPGTAVADGHYVDPCLATVALPDLLPGRHELVITQPVSYDTTREWCYLLGDFGVQIDAGARHARLIEPPRHLGIGDQVPQGLPFYGGNTILRFAVEVAEAGDHRLELGPYLAPLVAVAIDGVPVGTVPFPPYALDLGHLPRGRHVIALTVSGDRANTFGPLHLANRDERWLGPNCYRTRGAAWSDAWQLRSHGLLSPPRLLRAMG